VSKINDIKNMKRKQKVVSPAQALSEVIEETDVISTDQQNETQRDSRKRERKRVSFDLRIDLHKELKMQALIQEKNIYNLIEEALEKYLTKNK
jgi:DNA-nicking Smr family endonuclease